MNMNNIITNFKTMSNEVITFFSEIQTLLNYLWYSCDAERSFSAIRILNKWLRNSKTQRRLNSMMQRRLNAIMVCNIHKEKL